MRVGFGVTADGCATVDSDSLRRPRGPEKRGTVTVGIQEAVRTCFSKFATFEGRARRAEYWMFYLFLQIIGVIGYFILMVVGIVSGMFVSSQTDPSPAGMLPFVIVAILWFLAMLVLMIPFLAVSARRLHDMGQTGHWLWLTLAGLSIVPVIMAFFDSEWGPNRWGEDPKAAERAMQAHPPYGYAQQQYGHGQPQYGQPQQQYAQPQYPNPNPNPQQFGQGEPQADPFQQPPASPPQPPTQ